MLEIRDLTCGYDSKIILHDINFHIKGGEITGIIGPNGSGKTTLLRTITRVLRPGKGEVFLEGKNIWEMGFKELARNIAVVSQDFETGCMSVEEFILPSICKQYRSVKIFNLQKKISVFRQVVVEAVPLVFFIG